MPEDPITALLDQLAAHAERIDRLDARETGDVAAVTSQIAALAALAGRLDGQVAALAAQLSAGEPEGDPAGDDHPGGEPGTRPYAPAPARRWWRLAGEDRAQAIAALRAWVEQVYRPGYGHLAAPIGAVLGTAPAVPVRDRHPRRAVVRAVPDAEADTGDLVRAGRVPGPDRARPRRADERRNGHLRPRP